MNSDKNLRYGFTTGSCAAAAAKAAAYMLLTGKEKNKITILTPKGIPYDAQIEDITRLEGSVLCAVKKDGGDDPDITSGSFVYAKVSFPGDACGGEIIIDGGKGVGRVTMPGLDQPVGNAAINRVPRQMIEKEVREVCALLDYSGALRVEISVPDGEELAKKTFNPRLGIEGGISILGTSGVVEPMSEQALLDTILVELRQHRALGESTVAVSPGNYGLEFMKREFDFDLDRSVKCSNFIGDAIDMAIECGFEKMLLTGHIGKLIKLSGGMMNTHSKMGDCRMELMAAAAIEKHVDEDTIRKILGCVSTDAALDVLAGTGKTHEVMNRIMEKIMFYLERRADGKICIECMMYSNVHGLLAKSAGAQALLEEIR